jgi:hypothetical protein
MEALQRVKLAGFDMVIANLEVELDLLCRATALTWRSDLSRAAPVAVYSCGSCVADGTMVVLLPVRFCRSLPISKLEPQTSATTHVSLG